jgi:hypothetical protein
MAGDVKDDDRDYPGPRMAEFTGTIRKLGLEGGLWALVTDDGSTVELVDCPAELKAEGKKARVRGSRKGAEVTIGMVGDAIEVQSFELL